MSVPALTKVRVTLNGLEAWDPAGFVTWDFLSVPGGFNAGDWKLRIFFGGSPVVVMEADATRVAVNIPLQIGGGPSAGTSTLYTLASVGRTVDFPNKSGTVAFTDEFDSGTYSPTLVNGANVAASTTAMCSWIRVGNIVTVTGRVQADPTTAAGTLTELDVPLPVASNISGSTNLHGVATHHVGTTGSSGFVYGNTTNNRATVRWAANSAAFGSLAFTFNYLVQ